MKIILSTLSLMIVILIGSPVVSPASDMAVPAAPPPPAAPPAELPAELPAVPPVNPPATTPPEPPSTSGSSYSGPSIPNTIPETGILFQPVNKVFLEQKYTPSLQNMTGSG